jgi:hypothetical protein
VCVCVCVNRIVSVALGMLCVAGHSLSKIVSSGNPLKGDNKSS